jgi:methylase of polypeptide subunit release factors
MSQQKATIQYLGYLKNANTEEAKKQLFYNLLNEWFKKDDEAKKIISQMALGAEKTILNIPKKDKSGESSNRSGRADTQYRQVIIEFENDIQAKAKREHAEYQLKEYFVGNFNSGDAYDFYLIATDCVRWAVYGVSPESYLGKINSNVPLKPEDIELKVVESFVVSEDTSERFFHFIDRYLFRFEKQPATLDNILIDFGDSSALFMNVFGEMLLFYEEHQNEPELQTAYHEWRRFMSIAYGSFEDNIEVFVVHSYLSVFAKLIAYEVITHDNYIDYEEMRKVLDGSMFDQYNVKNFVENDFYQWVVIPQYFNKLHRHFSKISEKISDYVFDNVQSDILKGVYQKLIDLETRHALGEYYTPDWLCETVVRHFDFEENARILDPSCGSGSFLLASVNQLKRLHKDISAEEISNQVMGIDIHPLSVQIAKTTLLLSIGTELLKKSRKPIFLRVYLSNSLASPQMSAHNPELSFVNLFGEEFGISVNGKKYYLPEGIFKDPNFFDHAVDVADHLADSTQNKTALTASALQNIIEKRYPEADKKLSNKFHEIYLAFKDAKESGKDSIWKYILQNTYKPFFLKNTFDYIIGNPPWFTYNSIKNAEYQGMLKSLADRYQVTPLKKANMPHLEIAAIFMSHCSKYLLKKEGHLAFVLPRSFLSAEHHDNTRSGISQGFKLTEIWDLDKVAPLFNVPSCVLFADTVLNKTLPNEDGVKGKTFIGKPKQHNATYEDVQGRVKHSDTPFYYTKLQKSSAFSTNAQAGTSGGANYYKNFFKQGATIVPRNFYFVDIEGVTPNDWHDRIVSVKSSVANEKDGKEPWKSLKMQGRVSTNFLFRTAIAKNMVPFGMINPPIIILPAEIKKEPHTKGGGIYETKIKLLSPEQILEKGELEIHTWFERVKKLWDDNKTEKGANMSFLNRLDFQKGLTDQDLDKKYIAIYSASATDANAFVFERGSLDLEFLVDYAGYMFFTNDKEEAYYVVSFLNSETPNKLMKPFQAKGLFGPRHVSKKILEVPLPKYDSANPTHVAIAGLGERCTELVRQYSEVNNLATKDYNVGKERSNIRKLLVEELKAIDGLLEVLIG